MGRMASIAAARLVRALIRFGWTLDRQAGSHAVLTKPGKNPVVVPMHKGKPLKEGTAPDPLRLRRSRWRIHHLVFPAAICARR